MPGGGSPSAGSARSPPTRPGRDRGVDRRLRVLGRGVGDLDEGLAGDGSSTASLSPLLESRHSPPMNSCVGTSDRTFFSRSDVLIRASISVSLAGYRPGVGPRRRRDYPLRTLFAGPGRPHGQRIMSTAQRTATIVLAAIVGACCAAATAAATWTVKGHGYGHGVGLSQYGAYGYAEARRRLPEDPLSLLHWNRPRARTRPRARSARRVGLGRVQGRSKGCGKSLEGRATYTFSVAGTGVELLDSRGDKVASCGREGLRQDGIKIAGIRLLPWQASSPTRTRASLLVINSLGSEDYVRGVVANESPPSWPQTPCAPRRSSRAPTGSRPRAGARSTNTTTPAARSTAARARRPRRPTRPSRDTADRSSPTTATSP